MSFSPSLPRLIYRKSWRTGNMRSCWGPSKVKPFGGGVTDWLPPVYPVPHNLIGPENTVADLLNRRGSMSMASNLTNSSDRNSPSSAINLAHFPWYQFPSEFRDKSISEICYRAETMKEKKAIVAFDIVKKTFFPNYNPIGGGFLNQNLTGMSSTSSSGNLVDSNRRRGHKDDYMDALRSDA